MEFRIFTVFLLTAFFCIYLAEARRSGGSSRRGSSHSKIHSSSRNRGTHTPKHSSRTFIQNEGGGARRPDPKPQSHYVPSPPPIGFRPEVTNGAGSKPIESPQRIIPNKSPISQQYHPVHSGAPPHIQSHPALHPEQPGNVGSYQPPVSAGTIHNSYQVPTHPGILNNGHPPTHGIMSQPSVPGTTIIVEEQSRSNPSLGQMVKQAGLNAVVNVGVNAAVNRLFNKPSDHHNHDSVSSNSQNQRAETNPAANHNTTIIYNNYYGPQDHGQGLTNSNVVNVSNSTTATPDSPGSNSTIQNVTTTAQPAEANPAATHITKIVHNNYYGSQNHGQGLINLNVVNVSNSTTTSSDSPGSNSTIQNVTTTAQPAEANPAATHNTTIIYNNYYEPQNHGQGLTNSDLVNVSNSTTATPDSPGSNSTIQNVTTTAQPAEANPAATHIMKIVHNNYYRPQNHGQGLTNSNLLNVSEVTNFLKKNSANQNVDIVIPIYVFINVFMYFCV